MEIVVMVDMDLPLFLPGQECYLFSDSLPLTSILLPGPMF